MNIRYLKYRLKWRLAKWIDFKSPIHIDIELNSSCNLRCPICHQTANPRPYKIRHLSGHEAKMRISGAKAAGAESIKLNWRGEPLIHPEFFGILEYALERDFTDIQINTNLNANIGTEDLKSLARVRTLKVSLDSMSNYSATRPGGELGLVLYNLKRIIQLGGLPVLNRRESDLTEPIEEFGKELFKQIGNIKVDNRKAQTRNDKNIFGKNESRKRVYCGMPSRRMLISAAGEIYPCCVPYSEPSDMQASRGFRGVNWGKILTRTWRGYNMTMFRRALKNGEYKITRMCENCSSSDSWR